LRELVDAKEKGRATTPRAITEPLNLHPPEPKKAAVANPVASTA
jgi:hypothetical protein